MVRGVTSAWALTPIASITLGGRAIPVPPLTLGRFQRLLDADTATLARQAVAGEPPRLPLLGRVLRRALRFAVLRAPWAKRPLWWLVNRLPVEPKRSSVAVLAPIAAIVLPGVTEEEWAQHARQADFLRLFLAFAQAHDWPFISEQIRFGEPLEPGERVPSANEVTSGLLAVAKQTGYTMEGLTEMRLDGFYRLVASLREDAERAAPPTQPGVLPGVEFEQGIPAGLADLMARAKGEVGDG